MPILTGTRVFSQMRLSVADSLWMSLKSIVKVSTCSASAVGVTVTLRASFFWS